MRLTRAERHLLDEGTDAQRKAMGILLTVGRLAEAARLVPITSAHVSGASYKMIGDPGLEFLEDFAQTARVSVPTTVNPLGTDLAQWQELGSRRRSPRSRDASPGPTRRWASVPRFHARPTCWGSARASASISPGRNRVLSASPTRSSARARTGKVDPRPSRRPSSERRQSMGSTRTEEENRPWS